jgi:hypothetical protein
MGVGDEKRQPVSRQFARGSRARLGLRPPDHERLRKQPDAREDRERKERDRSYRLALASLGLSVVVAVVTPVASLLVAKQNAVSAEQQAEKAFVRDQKKAAYTDFFSAAEQLQEAEIAAGSPIQGGPAPTPGAAGTVSDEFGARFNDLQTKASDLDKKFVLVLVSGSPNTATAATKLDDFVAGNLQDAIQIAYAVNTRAPGWQDRYTGFINRITAGHASLDDFLNAVRQDMGSEPLDLK